jgi:diguanylate cyclase (GGDEF)-like protein
MYGELAEREHTMGMSSSGFSEAVSALAFGMAFVAMLGLFRAREAVAFGGWRWVLLAALAGEASLHATLIYGPWPRLSGATMVLAAILQLVIAVALFPLLAGIVQKLQRERAGVWRDRIERAAAARAQAETWLQLAQQVAHFGHWRFDMAAEAFEWSNDVYRIHGLEPDDIDLNLEAVLALFHAEDRTTVASNLNVVVVEGGSFKVAVRLRRPDSELRHVVMRGTRLQDDVVGVLVDVTNQKITEARMREANAVALQANAALKEMTLEDSLTGLANRRQFDQSLVHEFKRAVRTSLPLGLVLIDIDQFRSFNELYGQMAGDACLRRVAQAVRNVPRRTGDLIARFSGEEIAVLLPLADEQGTERVAQIILAAIQALKITHEASESGFVTISCGAAAFIGLAELNNPLELVRRADQALYRAKSEGGNRLVRYEPGLHADERGSYPLPAELKIDRML